MIFDFQSDVADIVASLQPQPSRASLRKKRIKLAQKGYVEIPFYVNLPNGAYATNIDLQMVSDGIYGSTCNIKVSVLNVPRNYTYGSHVFVINKMWHEGETISFGDSDLPDGVNKPLAEIINEVLLNTTPVNEQIQAVFVLRLEFDRDDFYTWDRGFFVRPAENAPLLIFTVNDVSFTDQIIFIAVEDTIPPPYLQGIYLFGADNYPGSFGVYMKSASFDDRQVLLSSYTTVANTRSILLRSTNTVVVPPQPNYHESTPYTERALYWTFISGDPNSQRSLYFPCTTATSVSYYIDGTYGSDDYTISEVSNQETPLKTLEAFFDSPGHDAINDWDNLYVNGSLPNTLLFKMNMVSSSPTTPIFLQPAPNNALQTTIYGHVASESPNCITNATIENINFVANDSITTMVGGTTQNLTYWSFCNPVNVDNLDPSYRLTFKNCTFVVPKAFDNSIDSFVYLDMSNAMNIPITIIFDTCLIGYDGVGNLNGFVRLSRTRNLTILFRNCTFANPFYKANPPVLAIPLYPDWTGTQVTFANCIFWQWNYSNVSVAKFIRCYNGDPNFVNDVVGNADFGKLNTNSPCYRQWMPGYGQNVGWDQTLPNGTAKYRLNISAYGANTKLMHNSILTRFDVRDKYLTNLGAAFIRTPFIMDTSIVTKNSEMLMFFVTAIPNVKTTIIRLLTPIEVTFPYSVDGLYTELPLLRFPLLLTSMVAIKEVTSQNKVRTTIEADYDTKCPLLLRYGFPDWWEPVMGDKLYYFFDVFDEGTGVDLSTLSIGFNGKTYKLGSPEISIEPLTTDKSAYRILFNPQSISFVPESVETITITVADCVANWGPLWDDRRANEVLNWGGLTTAQKRVAMVPCNFTLNWNRAPFYTESFEGRFAPPRRNTVWHKIFTTSWESINPHTLLVGKIYTDSFEYFDGYNTVYNLKYLDWTPYTVDIFWG